MAWVQPKVFWQISDYINAEDYNRIKNDVEELYDMLTDPDFELDDMGEDKAINDLWYADEFNVILDNLDRIAQFINTKFNKPLYFPNGHTPNYTELGYIEHKILMIYNRINGGIEPLYLGMGGYVGSRIQNRLL